MKCPQCNYLNGYNDKFEVVRGDKGDFVLVEAILDEEIVVECPACNTTFKVP